MSQNTAAIIPLSVGNQAQAGDEGTQAPGELFQGLVAGIPEMPRGMGKVARDHWNYIGERLLKIGQIAEIDLGMFRQLCETYELYDKAQKEVKKNGEFQKTPNDYVQLSPYAVARERHAARYMKLADKFLLNPQARKAIKIENPMQTDLDL